ncbi:GTPase activating protein [Histoplasma capsulatum H143]|uniref:GTPase activating protein n=1 Tax=Ajellomyces capsulatus (strain H143) TaxID=544712 RepID=C6HLT2_AJECH|nr:GTPase activating protein [Histoplasma capsulatum H143]
MADGPPPPDDGPAPDTPSRPESELPPLSPSPPEKTALPEPVPAAVNPEEMAQLEKVLQSDDFSTFLRKRSALEEEHAQGLKKLARAFHDSTQRIDNRQGTFSTGCEEINRIHDRMADHGLQFALSLQQMSEDLNDLVANMERGRKHWKQNGLNAEKRVQDAESMAEKAKAKYNSLAEQYDRARTGDAQPGKFGLKGHKSAAQHEQDLLRKVQHSDSEYASKVQTAQGLKNELMSTLRPQAVRALQDLVAEGDSGLSLQMQKFATFTEKLMLGNGLCVSPLKNGVNPDAAGFKNTWTPPPAADSIQTLTNRHLVNTQRSSATARANFSSSPPQSATAPAQHQNSSQPFQPPTTQLPYPAPYQQPPRQEPYGMYQQAPPQMQPQMPYPTPGPHMQPQYRPYSPVQQQPPPERFPAARNGYGADLPPLKPVFGVSLEELFQRDGTAIPMIVYQCIQGVELFGLNVEGIYRLSGNANHIAHLKSLFDNDSSQVDFTNPENFFHDVNSVAGLLKQFFRELPDPLFTNKHYADFINAARRDDDIQRRDALHALINNLPDPNYATLRALILHLNHVHERSAENRMNAGNIAISFGLTLMGSNAGQSIADSGWQARVIETILQNTFQIFDED